MVVASHNVEIASIPSSSRGQYATSSWRKDVEPSRVLVLPTKPILACVSSIMLGAAHVDADNWNLATSETCALVLCAFGSVPLRVL